MMLYLGIIIDEVQLHIRQQAGTVVDRVHSIGESSGYNDIMYLGIIVDEVQLHIRKQAGTVVDLVHCIGESSGYRPTLKKKKIQTLKIFFLRPKT